MNRIKTDQMDLQNFCKQAGQTASAYTALGCLAPARSETPWKARKKNKHPLTAFLQAVWPSAFHVHHEPSALKPVLLGRRTTIYKSCANERESSNQTVLSQPVKNA